MANTLIIKWPQLFWWQFEGCFLRGQVQQLLKVVESKNNWEERNCWGEWEECKEKNVTKRTQKGESGENGVFILRQMEEGIIKTFLWKHVCMCGKGPFILIICSIIECIMLLWGTWNNLLKLFYSKNYMADDTGAPTCFLDLLSHGEQSLYMLLVSQLRLLSSWFSIQPQLVLPLKMH
jgi:hypothetical protein